METPGMPTQRGHKDIFKQFFLQDPPQCSELTFTNLFIWRHNYRPTWIQRENCLLIILRPEGISPFGLQPVGTGDKRKSLDFICEELKKLTPDVNVCRVSEKFIQNYVDPERYQTVFDRDNSDYVYQTQDLIKLSGRKYHRKKNHLNRFLKKYNYEYQELDMELVECFLDMQERWCRIKDCVNNPDLLSEDFAIYEALTQYEVLDYKGGAIRVNSAIEAFSLGEPLNENTAIIHIEKANPEIPGLYTAINQFFCSHTWGHMEYINREQDLGIDGLRNAKESYYPHHMVNKYTIIPK